MVILKDGDRQLAMPAIHGNNMDQWIYTRSLILSSVSSTEPAVDQDFLTLASSIRENQRSIVINQLRDVSSDETVLYTDSQNPLLTVWTGEVLYVIECKASLDKVRRMPQRCCKELSIWT